jgi:integrase
VNEKYNYENILRQRATLKRGGIKTRQRVIELKDLLIVREKLMELAISDHMRDRDTLICDFLRVYMLRISEVVSLNTRAFDWERKEFVIFPHFEKNAKEKVYSLQGVPQWFIDDLSAYIRKYRDTFIGGYLFPSLSYKSGDRPFIRACNWTEYRWKKAVRAAGMSDPYIGADGRVYERLRSHGFRKAGITHLIEEGVPIKKIAAFTTLHPQTIMNYYNMVDDAEARKEIMHDHISKISEGQ